MKDKYVKKLPDFITIPPQSVNMGFMGIVSRTVTKIKGRRLGEDKPENGDKEKGEEQ